MFPAEIRPPLPPHGLLLSLLDPLKFQAFIIQAALTAENIN